MEITIQQNTQYGLVVSSRVIAKELGKRHSDVLRALTEILTDANLRSLIISSNYKDKKGEERKEYLLTKDGFTLYMFNIQGYQDFKLAYINKFNEMEKALREPKVTQVPVSYEHIKKTMAHGVPVMTVKLLQEITKLSHYEVIITGKKVGAIILRSEKLREFKAKNGLNSVAPRLMILYKEQVIAICKTYGVYEKVKHIIENYFRTDNRIEHKVDETLKKVKPFDDIYLNEIYDELQEIHRLESKVEKIITEEINPLYDKVIELAKSKRDLTLVAFNCMKYGKSTREKIN
ncbi:Rha family transcriptional regulator [Fusobacterium necrogenes]|uniref:Rha family transcriptional regulator n=1 Tax=Fusobacterium necrogenes TaxID=858 RepID=UPI00255CE423|nr:Rha family transcriptional regulator [Fusobacterium necrogenes]